MEKQEKKALVLNRKDGKMISRFCYNYTIKDMLYSLQKITKNRRNIHSITNFFQNSDIFCANSARTGLKVLLTSMNLKKGAKIGVQAYNCHTIFLAIEKAGFIPCFIDVNNNYSIDIDDLKKKINNIDALIVCHTFGIPVDMDKIKEVCLYKPIIEDCAHSLFSKYKNQLTGTISNAAIFSFGHGKYPSIGKGGFTIISDKKLVNDFSNNIKKLNKVSIVAEIKNIIINYIYALAYNKLIYSLITLPIVKRLDKRIDFLNKFTFNESRGFNSNIALFNKKFNYYKIIHQKQLKNGRYLAKKLKGQFGCIIEDEKIGNEFNYYIYPLRSKKRDKIVAALLKKGVESGKHFQQSIIWAKKFGYKNGDCPNTEKIVNEIFTIPSYYKLKEKQLKKIIKILKNFNLGD